MAATNGENAVPKVYRGGDRAAVRSDKHVKRKLKRGEGDDPCNEIKYLESFVHGKTRQEV